MRLTPSRAAVDIAVVGAGMLLAGVLLFQPLIVAWGGAMLIALAAARAVTWVSIAKVRRAGFAMSWQEAARCHRVARGQSLLLHAHIANQDSRAVVFEELSVSAASGLRVRIDDSTGEVPANGLLELPVAIQALRVGRHGVFGLCLQLRGTLGLFSITLSFSNPIGVLVQPLEMGLVRRPSHYARTLSSSSEKSRRRGDIGDFAELREHAPGDSFKHIDWKSSARKGALHVRRYELPVLSSIWCILDASTELWAGRVGDAPLDLAIDYAYSMCRAQLRNGHRVGFLLVRGNRVERIAPQIGLRQQVAIRELLVNAGHAWDRESCGLDERMAAHWVREHVCSLLPDQAQAIRSGDARTLSSAALSLRARAPFPEAASLAVEQADAVLFGHLASFGMSAPVKLQPQGPVTQATLARELNQLSRKRASGVQVHVVAPMPLSRAPAELLAAVTTARRRLGGLTWTFPEENIDWDGIQGAYREPARTVFRLASRMRRHQGELTLRHLGLQPRSIRSCAHRGRFRQGAESPPGLMVGEAIPEQAIVGLQKGLGHG